MFVQMAWCSGSWLIELLEMDVTDQYTGRQLCIHFTMLECGTKCLFPARGLMRPAARIVSKSCQKWSFALESETICFENRYAVLKNNRVQVKIKLAALAV